MRVIIWLFFILNAYPILGQKITVSHKNNRELSGYYDNDIFFFTDQYYTSGIDFGHGRLVASKSLFDRLFNSKSLDSAKIIVRYNYGHKIFTPLKIRERDLTLRDRPYAGWHYGGVEITKAVNNQRSTLFTFTSGLIGERSGIGNFQKWYHANTGITAPIGWENQIKNEFILELGYALFNKLNLGKKIDLISKPSMTIGNLRPNLSYEFLIRVGKTNGLHNSAINRSRLSQNIPQIGGYDKNQIESFVFFGMQGEYVFHNTFIEGGIINDRSPHTENPRRFVVTQTFGGTYSTYYTTFSLTFKRLSQEVMGGESHRFVRFTLAYRL